VARRRLRFCRRGVLVSAVVRTDVRKGVRSAPGACFAARLPGAAPAKCRTRGPGIRGSGPRSRQAVARCPRPPVAGDGPAGGAGRVWCGEASHLAGLPSGDPRGSSTGAPAARWGPGSGFCRCGMLRLPPQRSVRPTNVGCGTSEEKRRWRAPRPRASRRLLLRPTPARPQLPVLFVSRSLTPVLFVSRPQLPVQFLSRPQLPVLFEARSLTRVLLVLRRRPVAALERRRLRFRRTCCPTGLPLSCCRSPARA
jgi:hypothetical protein